MLTVSKLNLLVPTNPGVLESLSLKSSTRRTRAELPRVA